MRFRYKILISVIIIAAAFAAGRYSVPVKIEKVDTSTTTTDTDTSQHKIITKTELDNPNGTKQITTVIRDDINTQTDSTTVKKDTEVEIKSSKKLNVYALGGINLFHSEAPVLGVHISTNLIGPVTVGVFGLTDSTTGISIGLEF